MYVCIDAREFAVACTMKVERFRNLACEVLQVHERGALGLHGLKIFALLKEQPAFITQQYQNAQITRAVEVIDFLEKGDL